MGSRVLADRLRCVVSMHSDIQATVLPRHPLGFYVIHSGGTAVFDEYGMAFARRVSALGHETVLVSAGRRGVDVELAPADLVRLTGARTAPIARH
jgi:hypothetical protein